MFPLCLYVYSICIFKYTRALNNVNACVLLVGVLNNDVILNVRKRLLTSTIFNEKKRSFLFYHCRQIV